MYRDETTVYDSLASPVGVVVRESKALTYGFYTAAELRKLSVVHVTSSEQRDALSRPLPGGLYDPAMGPTDHLRFQQKWNSICFGIFIHCWCCASLSWC